MPRRARCQNGVDGERMPGLLDLVPLLNAMQLLGSALKAVQKL
jgi:hypothetical protein